MIAVYNAECWAEARTKEEIRDEIERVENKALTHHYKWNDAGCAERDWQRIDTLKAILLSRSRD